MQKYLYILILLNSCLLAEDIEFYSFPKSLGSTELIVAYRFSGFELDFQRSNENFESRVDFSLNFSRKEIQDFNWTHLTVQEQIDKSSQIIGLKKITIPNVNVKLKLNYDLKGKKELEKQQIKKFTNKRYIISDIIPAYILERNSINNTNFSDEFKFKNFNLIPNSSHEIAGGESFLKYYFEILNNSEKNEEFVIHYEVLDAVERVQHREIYNNYSDTNQIISFSNYIDISKLPTGTYYLRVRVSDQKTGREIDSKDLKFFVVSNRKPKLVSNFTEDELYERSLFATMNQEMVDLEFRQTKLIMNEDQIDQFNQLSQLKAQRRALYKFWSYRDPDPSTELNESRMEFERAIQYANTYYNEALRRGWNSDRGRILIKYGFPQQVDRYEQKAELNATEVWFYGSQFGGLFFYFVEMSNNNDFRLVHSTHPAEMQNEYWVEEFDPAIDDSGVIERNYNYMRENGRR